jgi:hypothetical protein
MAGQARDSLDPPEVEGRQSVHTLSMASPIADAHALNSAELGVI